MDPVDIMLNQQNVIPLYQPVISADTQQVIGYDVFPYFKTTENDLEPIAWFFQDSSIPEEFRMEINHILIQKALDYYFEQGNRSLYMFFNYDSQIILKDRGEGILNLLQNYHEQGLDYDKIIIQLKDHFIAEEIDSVRVLFNYLKSLGIRVALDHDGLKNGNLERLAYLMPSIVKIDLSFLNREGLPQLYRDIHNSLTLLSEKIGATIMFKGISTYSQLHHAWQNGGRFYQGSYLMAPQRQFVEPDACTKIIQRDFQMFVAYEQKKIKAQIDMATRINEKLKTLLAKIEINNNYDEIIQKVATACDDFTFRIYITDHTGLQLSANIEKNDEGTWELRPESRYKNWSWRPYFFETVARMTLEKRGFLSDLYTDIDRNEQIRTFSYPLNEQLFIFLDIPYSYLFEQEGLL